MGKTYKAFKGAGAFNIDGEKRAEFFDGDRIERAKRHKRVVQQGFRRKRKAFSAGGGADRPPPA